MNVSAVEIAQAYIRELSALRKWFALCFIVIATITIGLATTWPKSYTSFSTIYADNSNILQPLMEGNAVATGIGDQARMAQEILFNRIYTDDVLKASGWDVNGMTPSQKDSIILDIQSNTEVTNVGRAPASLIRIAHHDPDPVKAFTIAQKYTTLFIEESVVEKRTESRGAFNFIQQQVDSYQTKLQDSENRLSKFKSENNYGTQADANGRISSFRAEMERLQLDLTQLDTEKASVEAQLAGEQQVVRDLTEMNEFRKRINALQMQLDNLRSRFHDNYPDVVAVQEQISDLMSLYENGNAGVLISSDDLQADGMTPLHQELRSRLAQIETTKQSKESQLNGIRALNAAEMDRMTLINESDAQLAELTRDYNVTRDFYNDLKKKLENARVSMNLDEEQQGVNFKVQEAAVIPTQPDGLGLVELLLGSFILALAVPLGLLVLYMELDPRVSSESDFQADWPPFLIAIPPMISAHKKRISDGLFLSLFILISLVLYGSAVMINIAGIA
ncbi:MAG: XrtA system polysaccharide chain length determinant [Pseudomonadota bacterium]